MKWVLVLLLYMRLFVLRSLFFCPPLGWVTCLAQVTLWEHIAKWPQLGTSIDISLIVANNDRKGFCLIGIHY
ncbi:hypothetical protein V8C37DRAFT_375740 [Trichoderma ceciliae]